MSTTSTGISWTDRTWNPIRGCARVSPGCQNCYAERLAYRFSGAGQPYDGLTRKVNGHAQWTGKLRLVPEALKEPLGWRKPQRIFVNSMSDIFHEDVPITFLDDIWRTFWRAPQHTFQILTKRSERMREYLQLRLERPFDNDGPAILPNVHLGVSVEAQDYAWRIGKLIDTPAAVRFISAEPLLGALDLRYWLHRSDGVGRPFQNWNQPDWIIVGGESGPGARPLDLDWIRDIIARCRAAGVAIWVKQLGSAWAQECRRSGLPADSHGANWAEWPIDLAVREFPEVGEAVPA